MGRSVLLGATLLAMLATVDAGLAHGGGKDLEGIVNLNTAPPELLSLLPGVGPSKARQILSYRARHPFHTVDELVRVKGIGRRMVREMRSHLAVAGPSTAHVVAGSSHFVAAPAPPPPPAQPVVRPGCVANTSAAAPPRPGSLHPARGARDRPVRSAANHCAPPA